MRASEPPPWPATYPPETAAVVASKSFAELHEKLTWIAAEAGMEPWDKHFDALVSRWANPRGKPWGFDTSRPSGAIVTVERDGLKALVFVPVKDQQAVVDFVGVFLPGMERRGAYRKVGPLLFTEQAGFGHFAFREEDLKSLADPARTVAPLLASYDQAGIYWPNRLAKAAPRAEIVDLVLRNRTKGRKLSELSEQVGRAMIEKDLKDFVEKGRELEWVLYGTRYEQAEKRVVTETIKKPLDGSLLARQVRENARVTSRYAALKTPGTILFVRDTLRGHALDAEEREAASPGFKAIKDLVDAVAGENVKGASSKLWRQCTKEAVALLKDESVRGLEVDAALAIDLREDGSAALVAVIHFPDAGRFDPLVRKMLPIVQEAGYLGTVTLDADSSGDTKIHSAPIPQEVLDSQVVRSNPFGAEHWVERLLSEKPVVHCAVTGDALWLCVAGPSAAPLKEALAKVAAAGAPSEVAPFEVLVSTTRLARQIALDPEAEVLHANDALKIERRYRDGLVVERGEFEAGAYRVLAELLEPILDRVLRQTAD